MNGHHPINPLPTIILLAWLVFSTSAATGEQNTGFIGSETCASCHPQQYDAWQGSHHQLAMQKPSPQTVLGNFDNAAFKYNGVSSTFFKRDDRYIVRTDGPDGELQDFEVAYVFGVYPLQQYLLPLPGGRLQALSIAWDSRPAEEGGQRWYHLYPNDTVTYDDPLHWTGPYQNWNSRCAECHSTDFDKNYDAKERRYSSTFDEINVSCEACHGPGQQHQQQISGSLSTTANLGLVTQLAQRGEWSFPPGKTIAQRHEKIDDNNQIDACARCHARRGTLGDYQHGQNLQNTHRLSLPRSPLYHHDGQILDEVYVYGSFVQSKMHQAGVVCSNCHEPHSLALRAQSNGVCAQCHKPSAYNSEAHHHHPPASSGALCANCHMPETSYMGVDPRRDHSLRIPRPDLTVVENIPNACNRCHVDQDASWALQALNTWGVEFRDTATHPARAFAQATRGDARALPTLVALAQNPAISAIWRATAQEAAGDFGQPSVINSAQSMLSSADPLLRTSAVRSLEFLPLQQRYSLLERLIRDDITSVRLAVAASLAAVPLAQLPKERAQELSALFEEYLAIQSQHADMPGTHIQLGIFYSNRGKTDAAEKAYREALILNPQLVPARLNLADLLRQLNRDHEARTVLQATLGFAPNNADTHYALGLLETRAGNGNKALSHLAQAASQASASVRYRYVYAIALHDDGKPFEAIAQLESVLATAPRSEQVLLALVNYLQQQSLTNRAREHARTLAELVPHNRAYQTLYRNLMHSQNRN